MLEEISNSNSETRISLPLDNKTPFFSLMKTKKITPKNPNIPEIKTKLTVT